MLTAEEIEVLSRIVSDRIQQTDEAASGEFDKAQLEALRAKLADLLASEKALPTTAGSELGPGATAEMVWAEVEKQKASPENPLQITRKQLNAIKLIAAPQPVWSIKPGQSPLICGVPYVVID